MTATPATEPRVYDALRLIIERHGGTMEHRRAGHPPGGVWIITVGGGQVVIESNGAGYPPLDRLYEPKVADPRHYTDYSCKLIAGAEQRLLAMVRRNAS